MSIRHDRRTTFHFSAVRAYIRKTSFATDHRQPENRESEKKKHYTEFHGTRGTWSPSSVPPRVIIIIYTRARARLLVAALWRRRARTMTTHFLGAAETSAATLPCIYVTTPFSRARAHTPVTNDRLYRRDFFYFQKHWQFLLVSIFPNPPCYSRVLRHLTRSCHGESHPSAPVFEYMFYYAHIIRSGYSIRCEKRRKKRYPHTRVYKGSPTIFFSCYVPWHRVWNRGPKSLREVPRGIMTSETYKNYFISIFYCTPCRGDDRFLKKHVLFYHLWLNRYYLWSRRLLIYFQNIS